MKKPLVSVVLTTFNEGKYIVDSVQSILCQTFSNFEVIIVDDGSKDDTLDKLEILGQKDNRIIVVPENHNGRSNALNKGIQCSKGDYIAIMDSGDTAHPNRLQAEVEFLDRNNDITMVGTWAYWVNEYKAIVGEWKSPISVNRRNVYRAGGLTHSSIMCRRELFETIGYYNPNLKSAVDNDLFIRAVKSNAKIASLTEYLMYVSQRSEGICGDIKAVEKSLFKVKLRYLPYFMNPQNIIYTIMSLCGWLMPAFFLNSKRIRDYIHRYSYTGMNLP